MRGLNWTRSCLLCLVVLPAAVAAQEGPQQTKETALQFFSTLARNGSIALLQQASRWNFANVAVTQFEAVPNQSCVINAVLGPFEYAVSARKAYNSGGGDRFFDDRSDLERILTEYGTAKSRVYFDGSGNSPDFGYYQNEYTVSGYDRGKAQIDFSQVSSVSRSGSQVTVATNRGPVRIAIVSEDLATRMTFALEFLRLQCDPTAGLAF